MSPSFSRLGASTAVALIAVTVFSVAVFRSYYVASYQGVDENGYLITAKRLATRGDISKRTADPNEFVSSNWVEAREDVYYAKYPIGYPALCALAYKVGGPSAAFLVNPILAVLAVAGIFLLGRAMLGDFAGALAAIFLATNPMHAFYGISALSHSGAICFAVWGMYFVWRWSERGGWINAIFGGAFTAYATSVRYTEALLALPALALVIWRCVEVWQSAPPDQPRRARLLPLGQAGVMAAAGLAAISPLIIQHWVAYGSPWVSGYSLCGESTGFGWKWFDKNWRLMLSRMDTPGLFLIFPIGIAGLCYLVAHRAKMGLFLALWVLPSLLVYTAYYWAPEGDGPWYIRFFVSIFPPMILSALALLCLPIQARPAWSMALGLFALLVAGVNLNETTRQLDKKIEGLLFSKALVETVHDKLPQGSVILSEEHILNFVEFAGDYQLYAQGAYERNALQGRIKVLQDTDPHPFQRQKAKDIEKWLGNKTDAQLNDILCEQLTRFMAEGRPVAVVASQGGVGRWRGRFSGRYQFATLADCVEIRQNPKGEINTTAWSVYSLTPIDTNTLAAAKPSKALETKIDQVRFRIDAMRSEYQQQYPGAKETQARIGDMEKQVRDLQDELKRARARERAVAKEPKKPSPPTASAFPLPAKNNSLTIAVNTSNPVPHRLSLKQPSLAPKSDKIDLVSSFRGTNLELLNTSLSFKTKPLP